MNKRLVFLTVVPSPYQRDVFTAIARRGRVALQVHYLERAAPDSPWPVARQESWESTLPGMTLGRGRWRSHLNWRLPRPQPDELWVINGAMTDVTTQLMMRRLGRRFPWVFWGELPSTPNGSMRRRIQRAQYAPLKAARGVVAVGEQARRSYRTMLPEQQIMNQPYACRLDDFQQVRDGRSPNPEPVILFCGQMIARKGVDLLLAAFTRLVATSIPARLELVGREADLPQFLAAVEGKVRARVTYSGFKTPAELPAIFARADVFVLPSRHDGWGVVVNQAMGAGLPTICSDAVGAAHDLIQSDKNGIIVPAGDVEALTDAMRRLAGSPELRRALGAAAQSTIARFTPDRAAEFWEGLTEKLAGNT